MTKEIIKKVIKKLGKNLVAFLSGSLIGLIISLIYTFTYALPLAVEKAGLVFIALVPVFLVLYSGMGIIIGGIIGLVTYQIIKIII